jgi:hypothetical protein
MSRVRGHCNESSTPRGFSASNKNYYATVDMLASLKHTSLLQKITDNAPLSVKAQGFQKF